VTIEAVDDPAYLDGIRNDGDDGHAGSAARASQDVDRVDLGQQPSPGSAAAKRVDFVLVRHTGRHGLWRCRAAVPAGRSSRAESRAA
jgi:hypothetical protein